MFKTSLALAAMAVGLARAAPEINIYWGQSGTDSLASYCSSTGFEYITVSFVNNSPEQDPSGLGYPGTNFGAHCAASTYKNQQTGVNSLLLSGCNFMAEDIPTCQQLGKKVLLSIGGAWIDGTNYTVSSPQKGVEFADFLWGAFGPYDASWTGPRPFDFNGNHVAFDGYDFDIETKFCKFNAVSVQGSLLLTCPQPTNPDMFHS
jgi:chitinase